MLRFIFATIAYDPDPDLTPLTVRRLCKALFGRTGSQWLVVEVFGEKGRQHRSADSNPEVVETMAARYRHAAELGLRLGNGKYCTLRLFFNQV